MLIQVAEKYRPEAFAQSNQEMMGPEAQPGFLFFFPRHADPSCFLLVASAALFPVLTKALYLLVVFPQLTYG